MKKVIITIVILLIVVLGGALTFAIMNAQRIVERYRPQIESMASSALGSPVTFQKIEVNLGLSPVLDVHGTTIGRSKTAPGLSVGLVKLAVELRALLSGSLRITEVSVVEPNITIEKAAGVIKIVGLPEKGAQPVAEAPPVDVSKEGGAPGLNKTAQAPIKLEISKITLENGIVTFIDIDQGKTFVLDKMQLHSSVDVNADTITLRSTTFDARALDAGQLSARIPEALFLTSSKQLTIPALTADFLGSSLDLAASLNLDSMKGEISVPKGSVALGGLAPLAAFVPAIATFKPGGSVQPTLKIDLRGKNDFIGSGSVQLSAVEALLGILAVKNLEGPVEIGVTPTSQSLKGEALKATVNGAPFGMQFEAHNDLPNKRLSAPKFTLNGLGGVIQSKSEVSYGEPSNAASTFSLHGVQIVDALKVLKPGTEPPILGTLQSVTGNVSTPLGGVITQTLKGALQLDLRDITIKGFNLAGSVLSAVNSIPFLTGGLISTVPTSRMGDITSEDTKLSVITGSVTLANGSMHTTNFKALGSFFTFEGSGRLGFDMSMDLNATMIFTPEFSMALVGKVKEVERILDAQKQLVIPLHLSGKLPNVIVLPNVQKLVEVAATRAVHDVAKRAIEKTLRDRIPGLGGLFN